MTILVQPLGIEDLEWFVEVAAVRMLTEELQRPELVNLERLYQLAAQGANAGTAWVARDFSGNVGALGSILTPNPFNPDIMTLAEVFWWVDPTFRDTRAGYLLLKAFDKKASEVADESTMSLLPSSAVSFRSLEKRGHKLSEVAFIKRY